MGSILGFHIGFKIESNIEFHYWVPPLWSGFPDFGPDPDFFEQSGPDFAQKSGFFIKITKERLKCHILVWVDTINL